MRNESAMEIGTKRIARILGFLILIISAWLSYDGFDQSVTGNNQSYDTLATAIGITLAITISVIQFVFNSRYEQLNTTLKVVGFLTYIYSIYTNFLGATHLLGMTGFVAIATSIFMDVVPEPIIAWSFGDSLKGDLLGNIGKWVFLGTGGKPAPEKDEPRESHKPSRESNHGGGGGRERGKGRVENIHPEIAARMGMRREGDVPNRTPVGEGMRPVDRSQMGSKGSGRDEGDTGRIHTIPRNN
jgi:hypothetical protein